MPLVTTRYEHIVLNEAGIPMLAGTTMKVVELVSEYLAYGWSPEELLFNHPYLTLGQIHSALAYYWDNKGALDDDIDRRLAHVNQMHEQQGESSLMRRLKARKRA